MLQHQPFFVEEDERDLAFVEMREHDRRRDVSNDSFSSSVSSTATLDIEVTGNHRHEPFYDTRETKAVVAAARRRRGDEEDGTDFAKPAKKMPTAATVGFQELLEATQRLNEEEERVAAQHARQRELEEEEAQALRNRRWEEVKARLSMRSAITPMVSLRSKEWDDDEETDDEDAYNTNGGVVGYAEGDRAPLLPPSRRHPFDKTIYDDPQDYAYRAQLTQRSAASTATHHGEAGAASAAAAAGTARSTALSMDDPFANDAEKPMRKLMKREVVAPLTRVWHNVYNWGIYCVFALAYMPGVSIYEASRPENYYQDTYHE